jgi:hypothetical protein
MYLDKYFAKLGDLDLPAIIGDLESLLLLKQCEESKLQQFITRNAFLLPPLAPRRSFLVIAQPRFGDEYVADFAMYGEMNINWWTFVELERPSLRLFTKSGDPSAAFTHAIQQTHDWERWRTSTSSWRGLLDDGPPPAFHSLLLLGRRHTLTRRDQARLQSYGFVYTYDSLLDVARSMRQTKPTSVIQASAIPWSEFRAIRQSTGLFGLTADYETLTGNAVYAKAIDLSDAITDAEFTRFVSSSSTADAVADDVVSACRSFAERERISTPLDAAAARFVAFLYEMRTISWGEATEVPKREVAIWQRVRKASGKTATVANLTCLSLLHEAINARFDARADDVRAAVGEAVRSVGIFHHAAILTSEHYGLSLLVPGWCDPERVIYAAEMELLRAGGVVAGNLLINRSLRTLAVLW